MELDTTTILLEIINFLILIWLLKRFLYAPVLRLISERQQGIETSLQEAETVRQQASEMQATYQQRLGELEQQHLAARHQLEEELQARQVEALASTQRALANEEQKARQSRANQDLQWRRETEQQALGMATRFASLMLRDLADEHLQEKLIAFTIKQLKTQEWAANAGLARCIKEGDSATITTAFPISDTIRESLTQCLHDCAGKTLPVNYRTNPTLIAGMTIAVGSWSLGLSLADELKGFAECIHEQAA